MANIDLMLPDTIPSAVVDKNIPPALVREPSRWAKVRHHDGDRNTYVVPLVISDGAKVNVELLEMVRLTIAVEGNTVRLQIQPLESLGLIAATMARAFAVDVGMSATPGTSKYVDFPSGMGRAGIRIPVSA